jgi:hypothetical protein
VGCKVACDPCCRVWSARWEKAGEGIEEGLEKPLWALITTPNKAWKDNNLHLAHHLNDMIHNEQEYKTVPFKSGENVRILEEKEMFGKG